MANKPLSFNTIQMVPNADSTWTVFFMTGDQVEIAMNTPPLRVDLGQGFVLRNLEGKLLPPPEVT